MTLLDYIIGLFAAVVTVWSYIHGLRRSQQTNEAILKFDLRTRELLAVLKSIDSMAGTALWQEYKVPIGTPETRLRQAITYLINIRKACEQYVTKRPKHLDSPELDLAIEKASLWLIGMITELEYSTDTKEVWVVTPDLEPDASDSAVGKMVFDCMRQGTRYIFFHPEDLPFREATIDKLHKNIGLGDLPQELQANLQLVALGRSEQGDLFTRGRQLLLFRDDERKLMARCFEELVFTRSSDKGLLWQQHSDELCTKLRHELDAAVKKGAARSAKEAEGSTP
jgi:hypothetical protein